MSENTELQVLVAESGFDLSTTEKTLASFTDSYNEAREVVSWAKDITVTNEDQVDLMADAKNGRLKLKAIRVAAEKTRKELKEQALREGKAIDGVANIIKALIVPVEKHLEKQEKFAETLQNERKEKQLLERNIELLKYVRDTSIYNVKDMDEESFELLIDSLKESKRIAEAAAELAEKKAELQKVKQEQYSTRRLQLAPFATYINTTELSLDTTEEEFKHLMESAISAEQKYIDQQNEIKAENERLRQVEKRGDQLRTLGLEAVGGGLMKYGDVSVNKVEVCEMTDVQFTDLCIQVKKDVSKIKKEERIQAEKEQKEADEAERKRRKEFEESEKKRIAAEAELKKQKDDELKQRRAKEEAEKKALQAPDKTKLVSMLHEIELIQTPNLKTEEAKFVRDEVVAKLRETAKFLSTKIELL